MAGGAGSVGKGVFSGVRHAIPHHHRRDTMNSTITADSIDNGYPVPDASGDHMAVSDR